MRTGYGERFGMTCRSPSPYTIVNSCGSKSVGRCIAMEYERTTKDGSFTLTIRFNTPEQPSYSVESIEEMLTVLRQTADSLEFGMMDPSGKGGIPKGLPS